MKNNQIILWSLICTGIGMLIAFGVWYFSSSPKTPSFSCASMPTKPVIAAFGDSLVAGYGAEDQQGFLGPLSTQIGTKILNNGENGDTSAQALARINDVLSEHPNIVIVLVGGNDALQRIPMQTTQQNLESIITTLTRNHIQVILLGIMGGVPSDPYAPMFAQLAQKDQVLFIPNILDGLFGSQKYMSDLVHPNAAGYDRIASEVYPDLNTACSSY